MKSREKEVNQRCGIPLYNGRQFNLLFLVSLYVPCPFARMITNPYALTALACIGGILFGFDISSMSAILSTQNYLVYFARDIATPSAKHPGWLESNGPDSLTQGGITASMAGGSWLGSLSSGPISDKIGRRGAIMVSLVIYVRDNFVERFVN